MKFSIRSCPLTVADDGFDIDGAEAIPWGSIADPLTASAGDSKIFQTFTVDSTSVDDGVVTLEATAIGTLGFEAPTPGTAGDDTPDPLSTKR